MRFKAFFIKKLWGYICKTFYFFMTAVKIRITERFCSVEVAASLRSSGGFLRISLLLCMVLKFGLCISFFHFFFLFFRELALGCLCALEFKMTETYIKTSENHEKNKHIQPTFYKKIADTFIK